MSFKFPPEFIQTFFAFLFKCHSKVDENNFYSKTNSHSFHANPVSLKSPPEFIQTFAKCSFKFWRKITCMHNLFPPCFIQTLNSHRISFRPFQSFVQISLKGWRKSFSFKNDSSQISFKFKFVTIPTRIHSDSFCSNVDANQFHSKLFPARFPSNLISFKFPPEFLQTFVFFVQVSFKGERKSFSFKTHSLQISFKLNVFQTFRPFQNLQSNFFQRLTQIIFIQKWFRPDFIQI